MNPALVFPNYILPPRYDFLDPGRRIKRFQLPGDEYRNAVDELGSFEVRIKLLKEHRAWLEEKLLTRIEGQPPE